MKDVRKTKAQLIAELEAERKKSAGVDVSGVERQLAVERMRAEAMAMRSSKDLLKVLGVQTEEMINLGVDSLGSTIRFVAEEADGLRIRRRYYSFHNPRKFGISWTSPHVFEFSEEVVVAEITLPSPREQTTIDCWRQQEVISQTVSGEDVVSRMRAVTESWGLDRPIPIPERAEWTVFYVPFVHGVVGIMAPTLVQEHVSIVQELTAALSLGYIRYLDFQQLEEQNKTLEENLRLLRETQNQLVMQEKMASLGKLVAGVVHEMNTPMGAIRSGNDTLMRAVARMKEKLETVVSDEDASMRSVFEVVADANRAMTAGVERVGQIVHSLRDFVRLDEAEHVMADPRVGMESTLTLLQPQLEGITVGRQFEPIEPLYCSPARLNQVYMILLTNALDALQDDGEIGIRIFEADGHVCIQVRDNGAGIPPERLESIFEFGLSTGGPRVKMSVGLATAYAIVQEHGGDIEIESEVDVGTTVTVRLPRRTAA